MKKSSTRFRLSDPFRHLLWLTALLLGGLTTQAQTTWTGTTDSEWTTPANWSAGVPDANDDVTIPDVTNDPILSTTAEVRSVEVQVGAALSITATGSLTINSAKSLDGFTSAFSNRGSVQNTGQLILGNTAAVGQFGLWNRGMFDNAGGTIAIDRSTAQALRNPSGTFTNSGTITIGALAAVGDYGILNQNTATFQNNAGGTVRIDRSTNAALESSSTFTNSATITIGASTAVGQLGIRVSGGTFQNNSGGFIQIDTTGSHAVFLSGGTFANAATLRIGSNKRIGGRGIRLEGGTFTNNPGGDVRINRASATGITNFATFTNSAALAIGNIALTAAQDCIQNFGTFTNTATGEMAVDRAASFGNGIWNVAGTFQNDGKIAVGSIANTGATGILNTGTSFTNHAGASIQLDRVGRGITNATTFTNAGQIRMGNNVPLGNSGLLNGNGSGSVAAVFNNLAGGLLQIDQTAVDQNGITNDANTTLTNSGTIRIGTLGSIGGDGIENAGTFSNQACDTLTVFDNIRNTGAFTNAGWFTVNTAQAHTNTGTLTNDGIIAYPQGNPIPNVTNNDLIVAPISGCEPTVLPALQLGGSNSFTAGGTWYQDEALTQVAGTYNPGTNAFTGTNLAAGTHTLYFAATDNANGCTRTVSIRVELRPTAFTQGASVSGGPVCAGQTVTLSFDASECLKTGNTFTAQLSDASGAFGSATHLGPVSPGINPVMIPAGTPFGTGYRIRVVAANPAATSPASEPFRVNALGNVVVALYPATPGTLCQGQDLPVTFSLSTPGACPFPADNVFTVELSNATGSFANPRTLGVASPGTTIFPASLLDGLPVGTGYRVRILSSNPAQASFPSYPFDLRGPSLSNVTPGVGGVPVCRGNPATVSFQLPAGSCAFPEGNAFTAQLSNASGSFTNPVSLGAVQAGVSNSVTIPANSTAGTGYRIRIVSSNPALTSLVSSPFRVNAVGCNGRMVAEEAGLEVVPNPVVGGEIRVRVSGMDHPQFSLATASGRNVGVSVKTDGSGEFVLTPKQALPSGVYVVGASEGTVRLTRRVLVSE
jgi:hypothetical protein